MKKFPSVLVGAVTWKGHSHLFEDWLQSVRGLSYPNYDIFLANTDRNDRYYKKQKEEIDIKVIKSKSTKDLPSTHMVLAHAREHIRQETLLGDYDYCLMLDQDIFIPEDSIEILMKHDKDWVGFPYQYKFKMPCMFKSGWLELKRFYNLDLYTNEELLKLKPKLVRVYAAGTGCSLFKREVFEKVPFRTMGRFICGEDIWFNNEASEKGIECYVDTSIEPIHKPTSWEDKDVIGGTMLWAVLEYEKKNNGKDGKDRKDKSKGKGEHKNK